MTTGGAFFLKGLIDKRNKIKVPGKKYIYGDKPWIHMPDDDTIYELLDKELVNMIDPEYAHLITKPETSDLEINEDKLEEIENHFEVVFFYNSRRIYIDNDVCDIVFRMAKKSWLFSTT